MSFVEGDSENVRHRGVSLEGRGRVRIAAFLFVAAAAIPLTLGGTAMAAADAAAHGPGASRQGRKKRQPKGDAASAISRKGRSSRTAASADPGGLPFAVSRSSRVTANQGGRIVIFPFPGDDGTLSTQVGQLLAARGLEVLTDVKPVDTAEQYRELATTLHLAAYVEGDLRGTEEKARAVVRVRSGYSGRKMREATFKDSLENLPREISDGLWPKLGPSLAHACADAARPRRKTRGALVINAGTPIETIPAPPKPRTDDSGTGNGKTKTGPAAERKARAVEHSVDESA